MSVLYHPLSIRNRNRDPKLKKLFDNPVTHKEIVRKLIGARGAEGQIKLSTGETIQFKRL